MLTRTKAAAPVLVLTILFTVTASLTAGEADNPERSPFAGKYLALHIRGRNIPLPFQDVQVRYLAEKCYLVGKVVPGILLKDRRTIGTVWLPLGDAAEIIEFDSVAKLREFYNLAH